MEVPDQVDLSSEYQRLVSIGYGKLIEKTLFHKFRVGKGTEQIHGCGVDLTKVFDATRTMLGVLCNAGKSKESPHARPVPACILSILLDQSKLLFSETYSFDDIESLQSLAVRVFIFRKLGKLQVFDKAFFEGHPEMKDMKPKRALNLCTGLLGKASKVLEQAFSMENSKAAAEAPGPGEDWKQNRLPLAQALIHLLQEIIWSYISSEELDSRISKIVGVGGGVKDQPWTSPAQRTE